MTATIVSPITTPARNPVAAACRVAAALLEEHGWCPRVAHDDEDRYDLIGALEAATHAGRTHVDRTDPADLTVDSPANVLYRQALAILRRAGIAHYGCDDLCRVNDWRIKNTASAVALILEAAELAEKLTAPLAVAS